MTGSTELRTHVSRALAWLGFASSLVWLLDIVSTVIVMKFWIEPADYGLALPAISLFPILDLASEMGLGAAIVQRDDHTEGRINTMFWLNLAASAILAAVLAVAVGPLLSWIHGSVVVGFLITSYGAKLLWQNVYVVPHALMRKQLRFKELSIIRVISNCGEFAVKVITGAAGLGVWCFVLGALTRAFIVGIGVQIRNPWRPRWRFEYRESIAWVRFGLKQSASQLVYHVYSSMDYQIVGACFGPAANGLYGIAYELVLRPVYLIGQTIQGVAFPTYARLHRDRPQLIAQFLSLSRLTMVIVLAFVGAILVGAGEILLVFYQPEYVAAALAARVLCVVGMLRAMSMAIPPLLDGVGRPGLNLTYNTIAGITLPSLFAISAFAFGDRLGYMSVVWAWAIGYPLAFGVLLYLALRTLDLPLGHYLRPIAPILVIAAVAVGVGTVARWTTFALAPGPRLVVVLFSMFAVFLVLLATWQGITPAFLRRSLAGKP